MTEDTNGTFVPWEEVVLWNPTSYAGVDLDEYSITPAGEVIYLVRVKIVYPGHKMIAVPSPIYVGMPGINLKFWQKKEIDAFFENSIEVYNYIYQQGPVYIPKEGSKRLQEYFLESLEKACTAFFAKAGFIPEEVPEEWLDTIIETFFWEPSICLYNYTTATEWKTLRDLEVVLKKIPKS